MYPTANMVWVLIPTNVCHRSPVTSITARQAGVGSSELGQNTLQMYLNPKTKYSDYEVIKHKYKLLSGKSGKYKIQIYALTMYLKTFENTFGIVFKKKKVISLPLKKFGE